MKMKPHSKPQAPKEKVIKLAKKYCRKSVNLEDYPCFMFAVRGYYLDTMGKKGKNDRQIYDDAIMIVTPNAYFTVNANCDPGFFRKRAANLRVGTHLYKPGIHALSRAKRYQYPAFRQAEGVTVDRDKVGQDFGWFGINIHKGGYKTVSSAGCQTIFPNQWVAFKELMYSELKANKQKVFPYILIENQGEF